MSLEVVTKRLRKLEDELPAMISEHRNDGDFWTAFVGKADDIVNSALEHSEYIQGRLSCILGAAGLLPCAKDDPEWGPPGSRTAVNPRKSPESIRPPASPRS